MNIKSAGSSSKGNCIIINDELILDAGISPEIVLPLTSFKLPLGVLISHHHQDHMKYAKEWTKRAVNVYCTEEEFAEVGLQGHMFKCVDLTERTEIAEYECYCLKAIHDTPNPINWIVDTTEGERIAYTTDTVGVVELPQGITHYITECNFSKEILERNVLNGLLNKTLAKRIFKTHKSLDMLLWELDRMDKSRLQQIYLCHLSDRNSDEQMFKDVIQKNTGVEVYVL